MQNASATANTAKWYVLLEKEFQKLELHMLWMGHSGCWQVGQCLCVNSPVLSYCLKCQERGRQETMGFFLFLKMARTSPMNACELHVLLGYVGDLFVEKTAPLNFHVILFLSSSCVVFDFSHQEIRREKRTFCTCRLYEQNGTEKWSHWKSFRHIFLPCTNGSGQALCTEKIHHRKK